MRKIIALLLAVLLLSACAPKQVQPFPTETTFQDASGYVVDGIIEYPDCTFSGTPSTDELRQTAARAFRDLLTVPTTYRTAHCRLRSCLPPESDSLWSVSRFKLDLPNC